MDVATIKFYDTICVPHTPEAIDFLRVITFAYLCWIPLQYEGVQAGIIRFLPKLAIVKGYHEIGIVVKSYHVVSSREQSVVGAM
jgi:hypothetical protein